MKTLSEFLADWLIKVPKDLGSIAMYLAVVGTATMVILQMVKDTFQLRRQFSRRLIKKWLNNQARLAAQMIRERLKRPEGLEEESEEEKRLIERKLEGLKEEEIVVKKAHESLITLSTAGDEKAFYSLNIQQLVGQLSAASQIVLDYSWKDEYNALFLCLAAKAMRADVLELLKKPPSSEHQEPEDTEEARENEKKMESWIDARNRVSHQIQRTLDGLQISMSHRWKYYNQRAAILVNFAFVMGAFKLLEAKEGRAPFLTYIVVAVFGGFVAPLVKDLLRGLQQLRARPR